MSPHPDHVEDDECGLAEPASMAPAPSAWLALGLGVLTWVLMFFVLWGAFGLLAAIVTWVVLAAVAVLAASLFVAFCRFSDHVADDAIEASE